MTPWVPAGEPESRQFIHPQFSFHEYLLVELMLDWARAEPAMARVVRVAIVVRFMVWSSQGVLSGSNASYPAGGANQRPFLGLVREVGVRVGGPQASRRRIAAHPCAWPGAHDRPVSVVGHDLSLIHIS